jgi:serine protease Do
VQQSIARIGALVAMPRAVSSKVSKLALLVGMGLVVALGPVGPSAIAEARGAPNSFADLAEQISPAVVNITTSSKVSTPLQGQSLPPGFEDFFQRGPGGTDEGRPNLPPGLEELFRNLPGQRQQEPRRSEALGSGFVISADGYIVTNNHVIEGADEISIEFFGGKKLDAKLVGTDPKTDIALLKVESDKPLPFVPFGDSDLMRVGDWVVAMGNPLGQGFSVSAGIVSARNRELSGVYDDYIQTDAAINRGNSGGPLFNMDGQVVGVNTAILSPNGGSIGIGFSMASNVVTKVVDQLREFGQTRRGWLGVHIQDVTPDLAEALGLKEAKGALVTDVPQGPAQEAGLKQGDVILNFDGADVADTRALVRRVADAPIGQAVKVIVMREGKTETLDVKLGRREDAEDGATPAADKSQEAQPSGEVLGLELQALDADLIAQLNLPPDSTGLVITDVDEDSDAFTKGLREGMIITEAGQQKVTRLKDLQDRIKEAKDAGRKSLPILVRQDGNPRFVALSVD